MRIPLVPLRAPARLARRARAAPLSTSARAASSRDETVSSSSAAATKCAAAGAGAGGAPQPFRLVPSYSLFAKRAPRPFPPPFHSPAAGAAAGEGAAFLSGVTNGDDAVLTNARYVAVADGVGQWNTRARGHAPLWARLMLHFWSAELARGPWGFARAAGVDPVKCMQEAYSATFTATTNAGARRDQTWQGTTTVCGAVLRGARLVVLNVGDSVAMVYRPGARWWALRTAEQWHWFDCPKQLGTNSPDEPEKDAVVQELDVCDGDVVILATDGLVDNMWDDEILTAIKTVLAVPEEVVVRETGEGGDEGRMKLLAQRIVEEAKRTAIDPFAESPYMERSIDEGLGIGGGKWDDISVVAAVCRSTA